jgi:hypothetical protein
MKKFAAFVVAATVLGLGGFTTSAEARQAATKKVETKVVKLQKEKYPDVYLIWSWICTSFEEQKYDRVIVKFEDMEIKIQCKKLQKK